MPSMVGILGRAPAVDEKMWCFLPVWFFWSRFGMKFVITETLWSSIFFKTIMVSLHRGRFVVVHLCSSFPIDPQNFSREGMVKHEGAVLGSLPKAKFFNDFQNNSSPPSWILNLQCMSHDHHRHVILLPQAKFHCNWTIGCWVMAKKTIFHMAMSAVKNLINFHFRLRD